MKNILTLFLAVLFGFSSLAQSPEKLSFQSIVRDASNKLVKNTMVGMKISVLQGSPSGTAVYEETHYPLTNINGLLTIEIGTGITSGDFSSINWSNGPFYVKSEVDPTGGTNYTITGTSELLSVPYALHANTADRVVNESQELRTNGDTIFITSGNYIILPGLSKIGSLVNVDECPFGFEGPACGIEWATKFETLNATVEDTVYGDNGNFRVGYTMTITSIDEVSLSTTNLGGFGASNVVNMTLTASDSIKVDYTDVSNRYFDGNGYISNDLIYLNYRVVYSDLTVDTSRAIIYK